MKRTLLLLLLFLPAFLLNAQQRTYSRYYYQRVSLFETLPASPDDIVFLGNSITDGGEWCELLENPNVKNRGISGDVTWGVYDRLDAILKNTPAKIFLLIGINDVANGVSADSIVYRTGMIVNKIKTNSPQTRIYLQSVLPVNDHYNLFFGHTLRWEMVPEINAELKQLTEKESVTYVDLYSHFIEKDTEKMDVSYTNDGLHLMGKGYEKWVEIVKPYVEE